MRRSVGIDVGGTFTDLLLLEETGSAPSIVFAKVPTTPRNQAVGVMNALSRVAVDPADLDLIIHGTTATTNAVLERKVARVGLITTQGFRDTLELGRRTRPKPYGLFGVFEPLVPRDLRIEVPERLGADGQIVVPLDEQAVADAVGRLIAAGCEALVIHFLHSYANPAHEQVAGAIARSLWPNAYVTLGSEILSEFREYERGTTASINAAVQPVLDRYLSSLQADLTGRGYRHDLLVMNGNGGTVPARSAAREAAKTVMSGPASGVMAAAATLAAAGIGRAVTYDMGGTSTDVALILDGLPEVSSEIAIDYGLPIHVPMVDVRTVGAGGGSIARVDAGGTLRVGPRSAGSEPGPIAYGRGGLEPTITDANLVLGRLSVEALGGDATTLERVRSIVAETLASPLGISVEEAALAVVTLGNIHMAGAIRMVSLSRGCDPRDLTLFAFGGAGPLHAVALARDLSIPQVLIPARPGLVNALGCLSADFRQDFVQTLNRPLDQIDMGEVHRVLADQRQRGEAVNSERAGEIVETRIVHAADMQFRGQTHLIRVTLPTGTPTRETVQDLFEAAYFARFEVRLPEIRAVIVNLTTSVVGRRRAFPIHALLDAGARRDTADAARVGTRRCFGATGFILADVYRREALPIGAELAGPAVVEQADATIWLDPGARAIVDDLGNLRVTTGTAP